MLKSALFLSQTFSHESYRICSPCLKLTLRRAVSTNKAIHLGIRRSKPRGKDDEYRPRHDRNRDTKDAARQKPIFENSFRGSRESEFSRQPKQGSWKPKAGPREDRPSRPYLGRNPRSTEELKGQSGFNRVPDRSNTREDSFRSQVREHEARTTPTQDRIGSYSSRQRDSAPKQYRDRKPIGSAHSKKRPDSFRQPRGRENSSLPPSPPPATRKILRRERRLAIYGPGDTLPGGIPRNPQVHDENENSIPPSSQQARNPIERLEKSAYNDNLEDQNSPREKWSSRDVKPRKDSSDWQPKAKTNAPLSIPYTTPASEFLYGTSVIAAALSAQRRKIYKLYIYYGENREVRAQEQSIRKLALARGIEVVRVEGDWSRLMDKMSNGRPHNGFILEASPLPKLPVTGLQPVLERQAAFHVSLDHQSREDEAVNGTNTSIESYSTFPRYPFILLLDGVLDPGNLGAIIRTAFFLGVDALAISVRNSAPLSPVALKASAGSCETLPIFSVSHSANFIDDARKNGWKFYAAVAPDGPGAMPQYQGKKRPPYYSTSTLQDPTQKYPSVLMLGGEGEGLRWTLQKSADYLVGVEGNRAGKGGVDSLNVSVAAGLLCNAFMKKPAQQHSARNQATDSPSSSLSYDSGQNTTDVAASPGEREAEPATDSISKNNGNTDSDAGGDAEEEDVNVDVNADPDSYLTDPDSEVPSESKNDQGPSEEIPSTSRLF